MAFKINSRNKIKQNCTPNICIAMKNISFTLRCAKLGFVLSKNCTNMIFMIYFKTKIAHQVFVSQINLIFVDL